MNLYFPREGGTICLPEVESTNLAYRSIMSNALFPRLRISFKAACEDAYFVALCQFLNFIQFGKRTDGMPMIYQPVAKLQLKERQLIFEELIHNLLHVLNICACEVLPLPYSDHAFFVHFILGICGLEEHFHALRLLLVKAGCT